MSVPSSHPQTEGAVLDETELKEPSRYAVILHNDDYTTMDFVLEVLAKFFQLTQEEAMRIMLKVHHEGQGVAGVYPHDIAEMKVLQITQYSKSHGHPLRVTAEPI